MQLEYLHKNEPRDRPSASTILKAIRFGGGVPSLPITVPMPALRCQLRC
ncbi:MAG: hypothetical protein HC849_06780 [Oscillatoriales cyanobacterium RU_3_3]|nr:hypothetical protein [Oscillatoriales cyanobacterium RU_3_3]